MLVPFPGIFLLIRLALLAFPKLWLLIGPLIACCVAHQVMEWCPRSHSVLRHQREVRRAGLAARGYDMAESW